MYILHLMIRDIVHNILVGTLYLMKCFRLVRTTIRVEVNCYIFHTVFIFFFRRAA